MLQEWRLQHFIVPQRFILHPEKKFYSQLTPNPNCHTAATFKSNPVSINIYKAYLPFSATAVMNRIGMKRTCCCFNVQSITSKSGLLSSTGPGILQFISIFLHLEYQVEKHQPLTGCTSAATDHFWAFYCCFMKPVVHMYLCQYGLGGFFAIKCFNLHGNMNITWQTC